MDDDEEEENIPNWKKLVAAGVREVVKEEKSIGSSEAEASFFHVTRNICRVER